MTDFVPNVFLNIHATVLWLDNFATLLDLQWVALSSCRVKKPKKGSQLFFTWAVYRSMPKSHLLLLWINECLSRKRRIPPCLCFHRAGLLLTIWLTGRAPKAIPLSCPLVVPWTQTYSLVLVRTGVLYWLCQMPMVERYSIHIAKISSSTIWQRMLRILLSKALWRCIGGENWVTT